LDREFCLSSTGSFNCRPSDGKNNHVLATLAAGKNPYALAVNAGAGKLHVANLDERSFTIIDVKDVRRQAR
jgi:DNA-binding beta-propeller fold protein YncE